MVNIIKQDIEIEEALKNKLDKLIFVLYSKLHNWYDKDNKYTNIVNDMYEDNVLYDDIKELNIKKEKYELDIEI